MGNFNNVSMGNGLLKIGGVDVGYLKGDVNYKYNYEVEDFKVGVPLQLAGSITKELIAELTAPIAEISVENIAMALGGLTPVNTGSTETISTGSPQTRTFAAYGGAGLEAIILDGPAAASVVVKNTAGTTTYTAGTDYLVAPGVTGPAVVWRNPAGSITSGQSVTVSYEYTAITGQQINLGTQFSLAQVDLEFIHTSPVTNKAHTVKMWKATTNGAFEINFAEGNFLVNNVTFKAIRDESHPTNPLGYYHKAA